MDARKFEEENNKIEWMRLNGAKRKQTDRKQYIVNMDAY